MNKVLFVTYNANSYSGAAFQALRLSEELKKNGKEVILCNFTKNKVKKDDQFYGESYHLHPERFTSYFLFSKILFRNKISIVHFHVFLKKFLFLSILMKKKVVLKTTLIGDDDFDTVMKSRIPSISKYIIKHLTANVVLSDYTKVINSKYLPLYKIKKIPNGVEIPEKVFVKEKEKAVFCTVGVICKRKQTLEIIKYFHLNYSSLDNSFLYIIGPNAESDSVPEFDKNYYSLCQEYIAQNNIEKKVLFVGKKGKSEVMEYYKKSIGFLFFSLKEGMPNVLLEAMSFNCIPVVTGMHGVSQEIIRNGIDGFILEKPQEDKIPIEDLHVILKSFSVYYRIKKRYSFRRIKTEYIKLYQKLEQGNQLV